MAESMTLDTLAILGCGALGTAILLGLLSKPQKLAGSIQETDVSSIHAVRRFIACVRRNETAAAVRRSIARAPIKTGCQVETRVCANVDAARDAGIVILAVQPHLMRQMLQEPGMTNALDGKIIISVAAGVTVPDIEAALDSKSTLSGRLHERNCKIVRVMPNINCLVEQSTTVIETGSVEPDILNIVSGLFECVGRVFFTEPSTMDACTALCGSTPGFLTVVLEGLVEGAIASGLKADEALQMAAHAMMGTASLVQQSWQPARLRHEVTSPGGSTIQGVLALEEDRVRWSFARALSMAAGAAGKLGMRGSKS